MILLYILLFPAWLRAQPPAEMKTLLGEDAHISAFGSIRGGVMPFVGSYRGHAGGDLALVLNNFFFGGYGSRSIEFHSLDHRDDNYYEDKQLGLSHGGIFTGVSFLSRRMVQYSVTTDVGWGYLLLRDNTTREILSRDRINLIAPALQLKLNVTPFVQLCFGVAYQYLFGVDFHYMENVNFQGFASSLSVRFGWF
ncbi:MAG: hypothetical protein LBR08_13255 [Bacteroidales bacterium]|nr:hypothetical protein [Bacteroidales bacterium]